MNKEPEERERRKFQRLNAAFTLTYRINHPLSLRMSVGWDVGVSAVMVDLSEDGMAFSTDYDIPVGTIISMKFTLINLDARGDERVESMRISGEVKSNIFVARKEHRLGIKFTQIAEKDKTAITNFLWYRKV